MKQICFTKWKYLLLIRIHSWQNSYIFPLYELWISSVPSNRFVTMKIEKTVWRYPQRCPLVSWMMTPECLTCSSDPRLVLVTSKGREEWDHHWHAGDLRAWSYDWRTAGRRAVTRLNGSHYYPLTTFSWSHSTILLSLSTSIMPSSFYLFLHYQVRVFQPLLIN